MADVTPNTENNEKVERMGAGVLATSPERVLGIFGLKSFDDLYKLVPENGKVLDVGSGLGALENLFKEKRPDVEFVSINPGLKDSEIRQRTDVNKNRAVAAFNPELPFESGTFDLVIDSFASLFYCSFLSSDKQFRMVNELVRVARGGGVVFTGPIINTSMVEKIDKKRINEVQTIGVNAEDPTTKEVRGFRSLRINILK
jgi:SAM-dependent methyltransferase